MPSLRSSFKLSDKEPFESIYSRLNEIKVTVKGVPKINGSGTKAFDLTSPDSKVSFDLDKDNVGKNNS